MSQPGMNQPCCPILSAGALAAAGSKSVLVGAPKAQQVELVRCVETSCRWYVVNRAPTGEILAGVCAITALPALLDHLARSLSTPKN